MDLKKLAVGGAIVGAGLLGSGYFISQSNNPTPGLSISDSCQYSCISPDRDCSDFSSQNEAQTYFECCGFSAENDPMKLDSLGVGNGIACESN